MDSALILCVEDHPFYRAVVEESLQEQGYKVFCTADGQSVQKFCLENKPDLVLIDIKGKNVSGVEVCRRLKSEDQTRDIPVMFLSSGNEESDRLESFHCGGVDHIPKPFVKEELLARIRIHINQKNLHQMLVAENLRLIKEIERRKTAEELLIRSERFSAVGTLVQGVAHEFNNISGSLRGYSELALMRYGDLDPELKVLLERIQDSAERQIKVVSKIMSVSGKDKSEKSQVKPSSIALDALDLCAFKLKGGGVKVVNELEDPWDIFVDSHQITQVLLNLIVNACDAMSKKTNPIIEIRGAAIGESAYAFSIKDNGRGILPEHQEEIFEPFFSTKGEFAQENSPEKNLKGNGLGLSISRRIVQKHGGDLEVRSSPEEGTVFTLTLPRTAVETADGALENLSERSGEGNDPSTCQGGDYILVVEDTADSALILRKKLEWEKIPFKLVHNGEMALEAVQERMPALIFLDICMPIMDGEMFLERLDDLGLKVPVIVMSAMMLEEKIAKLKKLGCREIWNKPVDLQLFGKKAKEALADSSKCL